MMLVSPGVNTGFRTCLAVTPTSCKLPDIVTTKLAPGNECRHVPPGKQIRLDFLKGYRLVGGWATRPKQQLYIAYVCVYSKNIYKCIHICMYIYVYVYVYTPTYTTHNTHIHMYTYVTYVCMYIYIYILRLWNRFGVPSFGAGHSSFAPFWSLEPFLALRFWPLSFAVTDWVLIGPTVWSLNQHLIFIYAWVMSAYVIICINIPYVVLIPTKKIHIL